jgi:hypothetical protein
MAVSNFIKSKHCITQSIHEKPPTTPFFPDFKKVDDDSENFNMIYIIKFDFFVDLKIPEYRYSKEIIIFKDV